MTVCRANDEASSGTRPTFTKRTLSLAPWGEADELNRDPRVASLPGLARRVPDCLRQPYESVRGALLVRAHNVVALANGVCVLQQQLSFDAHHRSLQRLTDRWLERRGEVAPPVCSP
jgi:hypothetical protein